MNKICTYKVAEHLFRFILPDSEKLWDRLDQAYAPFTIDETLNADYGQNLLFTLELCKEIPLSPMECIYDSPTEDGETVVKMYKSDDGWYFETSPDHRKSTTAWIWASKDFSRGLIKLESMTFGDALFSINNAAMLLYAFASACKGTIEMHASVIENSGKAYLFLGHSGTGKSTHSSLWLKHIEGSTLMNDDNPIVRIWEDGRVIAYGSPWSGKTPCYKNISAPVGADVKIRQCPENKIRKMSVLEGYTTLFSSISGIKDDDSEIADGLNATLSGILSKVPCYLLDCRPDEEAARVCADTVRY